MVPLLEETSPSSQPSGARGDAKSDDPISTFQGLMVGLTAGLACWGLLLIAWWALRVTLAS